MKTLSTPRFAASWAAPKVYRVPGKIVQGVFINISNLSLPKSAGQHPPGDGISCHPANEHLAGQWVGVLESRSGQPPKMRQRCILEFPSDLGYAACNEWLECAWRGGNGTGAHPALTARMSDTVRLTVRGTPSQSGFLQFYQTLKGTYACPESDNQDHYLIVLGGD